MHHEETSRTYVQPEAALDRGGEGRPVGGLLQRATV